MKNIRHLLFCLGIFFSFPLVAQVYNPDAQIDKTTDSDRDGIPDYIDLDDDNDGILDKDETLICGANQSNLVVAGSQTIGNFSNATLDSYAKITSGNSSANIIATYGKTNTVSAVGRVMDRIGPNGQTIRLVNAQYYNRTGSTSHRKFTKENADTYHFAFREDKFNLTQSNRKFVIEYDRKGESHIAFNEWGTYISNGEIGTLYVNTETSSRYSAFVSYRSGAWVINNKKIISSAGNRSQDSFTPNVWYRIKTEYILIDETTLRINNFMTQYNTNGTLDSFPGQDTYTHTSDINIDLNGNHSYLINGFQTGVLSDSEFVNTQAYWTECDTDGDGIPNRLDLDSDNDGCADSVEGTANFTPLILEDSTMNGGNQNATSGNFNKPMRQNLGNNINKQGIPTIAGNGQGIGTAYTTGKVDSYCACFKNANNSASQLGLSTKHGITLLQRAGETENDWPMVRKGAWTVLESNTKGLVITRMSTAQINAITRPQVGMMTYDTDAKCFKIYDGTKWSCFKVSSCPDY